MKKTYRYADGVRKRQKSAYPQRATRSHQPWIVGLDYFYLSFSNKEGPGHKSWNSFHGRGRCVCHLHFRQASAERRQFVVCRNIVVHFSIMELLSRVRALLRRAAESAPKLLRVGDIRLDQERYLVFAGANQVELTFKEFELLRLLMMNPKVVLSRETIMQAVWETNYEGETRTVDVHIKTLRQKLGACGKQIGTVRNVGYVIS
jgi:DNA-binding winged helix-turn-helix (wHTH) protein